jgi:hypothetical protein
MQHYESNTNRLTAKDYIQKQLIGAGDSNNFSNNLKIFICYFFN